MAEQNNIDKLFKDGLSGQSFDFNPAAWNKMEQMIIADEKKRKGIWLWWSAGAAAFLALLFGVFYYGKPQSTQQIAQVVVSDTLKSQTKSKQSKTAEKSDPTENEINQQKITQEKNSKASQTENDKVDADIDNQIVEKEKKVNSNKTKEPVTLKQTSQKPVIPVVAKDDDYVDNNVFMENDVDDELSNKEKRQLKKQQRNEAMLAFMEYRVVQLKIKEEGVVSSINVEKTNNTFGKKINFNIIAGVNASQGFLNNDLTRTSPSIDPIIGLGTSIVVNSLVSIDINALYHKRGGLSPEKLPENYVAQGATEIAKSLHYIDVPFYINYRFKNRHAVRFGLQYSQLLGTVSEVTSTTSVTEWKQQNYFANYDVAGIVGYKYLVNERFNVGIRGNFGLFDVTLGQPAGENTFDMNRQLRFLLEYKLLKY